MILSRIPLKYIDMEKTESNGLQVYEVGFHIIPVVEEEGAKKEASEIKALITKGGGQIISEQSPELKTLSYEIIKNTDSKNIRFSKAFFGWVKFEADPVEVTEIQSGLKGMNNILRFIVVKTVKENTIFSKIADSKREVAESDVPAVAETAPVAGIVEADMDKSIEALIEN